MFDEGMNVQEKPRKELKGKGKKITRWRAGEEGILRKRGKYSFSRRGEGKKCCLERRKN